ncbi:alpha/beta fold hydrolase [bacterium]|nr:alpha/beta fold hydrolase [bacterium]MBP5591423.1 alpha/beta fold hydrolase [bacterium]
MIDNIPILQQGFLQVSDKHKIYYATMGNPDGIPLLCFHGGPGATFKVKYIAFINKDKYHTILFHQRGCGNSIPLGETHDNTPDTAIADAKKLLDFLNVKECYLMGFSYGSTLAMLFAMHNPTMVKSLFLSSLFIPYNFDEQCFGDSAKNKNSESYNKFISAIGCKNSSDLLHTIDNAGREQQENIIHAWINWEIELFTGRDSVTYTFPEKIDDALISSKHILLHYAANNYFGIRERILNNLDSIKNIPITIIHGDCDYFTPISIIYELQKSLHQIKIVPVVGGGHVGSRISQILYDEINSYITEKQFSK